jgi:hypothetical protein
MITDLVIYQTSTLCCGRQNVEKTTFQNPLAKHYPVIPLLGHGVSFMLRFRAKTIRWPKEFQLGFSIILRDDAQSITLLTSLNSLVKSHE